MSDHWNWLNQNTWLGITRGVLLADLLGMLLLAVIVWKFHGKPIANSIQATYELHELAYEVQNNARIHYANSTTVSEKSLRAEYTNHLFDVEASDMQELAKVARIEIPKSDYSLNTWGGMLAISNFLITGNSHPALISPNLTEVDPMALANKRAEKRKEQYYNFW